jgi:hypothetical protein
MVNQRAMSMQNRQPFTPATCSRTITAVGAGSFSLRSSLEIFPEKSRKASGIRAENTAIGVGTMPS